jgi:hypothetical protein
MDLSSVARTIRKDWKNLSPYAEPYVEAMSQMTSIEDNYYYDSGSDIVARFLANASTWRGPVARETKALLNAELKRLRNRR